MCTVVSTCSSTSHSASHPQSTLVQKHSEENSRNKQLTSVKLRTEYRDEISSHSTLPQQDTNHPYVQCVHTMGTAHPLVTRELSWSSDLLSQYQNTRV